MDAGIIMIDCKGLNLLAESTQEISGLYARLTEARATDKVVVAHNLVWGDTGKTSPVPVILTAPETNLYVCTVSTLQIRVSNTDEVTIVNTAPSAEP